MLCITTQPGFEVSDCYSQLKHPGVVWMQLFEYPAVHAQFWFLGLCCESDGWSVFELCACTAVCFLFHNDDVFFNFFKLCTCNALRFWILLLVCACLPSTQSSLLLLILIEASFFSARSLRMHVQSLISDWDRCCNFWPSHMACYFPERKHGRYYLL